MFIVLLKFSSNKQFMKDHMKGHVEWLNNGFEDGVFQLSGSLDIGGGGIIAQDVTKSDLESRINQDPFVIHNIVTAEIIELVISKANNQFASIIGS